MKLLKKLKFLHLSNLSNRAKSRLINGEKITSVDPGVFEHSIHNPTDYYKRSFQDFHHVLPQKLRDHRNYFAISGRGFGEDAFHTMWWRLTQEFKPSNFLEIGVYRGQVLSLISLIGDLTNSPVMVSGISPFCPAGDSVSNYRADVDYFEDTLDNCRHFGLPEPELLRAYSTDPEAVSLINSKSWDMIYIDGNHDYDVVVQDWEHCSKALKIGGVVVLDDAGLSTSYKPPRFATGGHPGPSRLAEEIDRTRFTEILQVGHNRAFVRNA